MAYEEPLAKRHQVGTDQNSSARIAVGRTVAERGSGGSWAPAGPHALSPAAVGPGPQERVPRAAPSRPAARPPPAAPARLPGAGPVRPGSALKIGSGRRGAAAALRVRKVKPRREVTLTCFRAPAGAKEQDRGLSPARTLLRAEDEDFWSEAEGDRSCCP